jgi:hypothetical protein
MSFISKSGQDEKQQLSLLTRHFCRWFSDNELISQHTELGVALTHILSLLALPGLMISLWLYPKYSYQLFLAHLSLSAQDLSSLVDKCFFISLSMVIMGFVTLLQWDSLFPGQRDYGMLIPLPIPLRTLFSAKVAALLLFLLLFSVAINGFSTIIFPFVVNASKGVLLNANWYAIPADELKQIKERASLLYSVRFVLAHAISVLAGNAFVFFSCVSIQGLLMNVLSYRWFKRVSRYFQLILMFLFLSLLFLFPRIFSSFDVLRENKLFVSVFPPIWFLGVYESLLGQKVFPEVHRLTEIGLKALTLAGLTFVITYLVSYKRQVQRCFESGIVQPRFNGRNTIFTSLINSYLLRSQSQKASFYFVAKTLVRSHQHKLFLGAYIGVGLALVAVGFVASISLQEFEGAEGLGLAMLSVPLILSFFTLVGMRVIFTIPAELRANWIFKLSAGQDRADYLAGVYKVMLVLGVAPLVSALFPLYLACWHWSITVLHLSFSLILVLILLEILLFRFQKIPFTCSYLPGKANIKLFWAVYLFSFTTYAYSMTSLESWMLEDPIRLGPFYFLALALLVGLAIDRSRFLRRRFDLIYEEEPEPAVRTLDLSD